MMKYFPIIKLLIVISTLFLITCEDVDTTSPNVIITNPINGSIIHETVNIVVSVSDNSTIKEVVILIDGVEAGKISSDTDTYMFPWKTVHYQNNSQHTILAKAKDSEGNKGQSDIVTITIDNEGYEPSVNNLESPIIDGSFVNLRWSPSNDADFNRYEIFKRSSQVDTFEIIDSISQSQSIVYTDTVDQTISYYYFIRIVDDAELYSDSNIQFIDQTQFIPPEPNNFMVHVNGSFIELSWDPLDISDFNKYVIVRNTISISKIDSLFILDMSESMYSDSVSQFNEYEYSMIIYDDFGNYVVTDIFRFTLTDFQPNASVLCEPIVSGSIINLSWSINEDSDFSSYNIFRSQDGLGMELIIQVTDQLDTTFLDDVTQGLSYMYLVSIIDKGGLEANSNTVSISDMIFNPNTAVLTDCGLYGDIITLTWSYMNDVDFEKFEIIRNDVSIANISAIGETTFQDVVTQGQDYNYQIKVVDIAGLESISNSREIFSQEFYPPSVEINQISYSNGSGIVLAWNPSIIPDFNKIELLRSSDSTFTNPTLVETIVDKNQNGYSDNTIQTNDSRYFYKLKIYDTGNLSTISNWKYLSFFDDIMYNGLYDNNHYPDLMLVEIDGYNARPIILDLGAVFDVSPDGKYAFVYKGGTQGYLLVDILNETYEVIVVDGQQGGGSQNHLWTSDSKKAYFRDAHRILEYDVNTKSVNYVVGASSPLDEKISVMYVSEGSGKVVYDKYVYYFGTESKDVFVYSNGTHQNITNTGGSPGVYFDEITPIINYNGSSVYYTRRGILYKNDLISNVETEIMIGYGWLLPESIFSRDDTKLYVTWYQSSGDYSYGLYNINLNDGTITKMYDGKVSLQDISTDGEKILLYDEVNGYTIIMDRTTYQIEFQIPVTGPTRWVKNRWTSN